MPIYSYKCNACEEEFDLLVGFSEDEANLRCPKCGSDDLSKKISLFGLGGSSPGDDPGCVLPS